MRSYLLMTSTSAIESNHQHGDEIMYDCIWMGKDPTTNINCFIRQGFNHNVALLIYKATGLKQEISDILEANMHDTWILSSKVE